MGGGHLKKSVAFRIPLKWVISSLLIFILVGSSNKYTYNLTMSGQLIPLGLYFVTKFDLLTKYSCPIFVKKTHQHHYITYHFPKRILSG